MDWLIPHGRRSTFSFLRASHLFKIHTANAPFRKKENLYLRELNRSLEEIHLQQEQLQHDQRLCTIGTLTSCISHEFNNLLTPIMGYSGMLRANLDEDSTIREDLDEIYNASVKAKELIQQITALSRKNSECAFEPLQLSQIIPRIIRVVESLKPVDTKLITYFQFSEHYIMGPKKINRILLNLCTNAFHAMPKGQGTLRVEGSLENCEGAQYAVFWIWGIGIIMLLTGILLGIVPLF